jgi:endonuclease/exonuclease/phosphatase family metal-dependent hydrolase
VRVATLNLASGRRAATGPALGPAALAAAVAVLDADVVSVQEVDTGQPRSHGADQPAVLAAALGAADWRSAPTVVGTPGPAADWTAVDPVRLRAPADAPDGPEPRFGIALFSRVPVRRWHVLGMAAGRARLPVPMPDPRTGAPALWWLPDEPRAAVAAELPGLTVVGTHLSFAPHTAARQLRQLQAWARSVLPGPVLVAGDLNLAGPLPAVLTGGARLVRGTTYPAHEPWVQLDHLLALGGLTAAAPEVRRLAVGDHRAVIATVRPQR